MQVLCIHLCICIYSEGAIWYSLLIGMLNFPTKGSTNMQLLTYFNKCWTIRGEKKTGEGRGIICGNGRKIIPHK